MTAPQVVTVDINTLLPNPRHGEFYPPPTSDDSHVLALRHSIATLGLTQAVLVAEGASDVPRGTMLSGHFTVFAAKEEGITEVPAIFVPCASAETSTLLLLGSNVQRVKTAWTRVMEFNARYEIERGASKTRQRNAGGSHAKGSDTKAVRVPPTLVQPDADTEADDEAGPGAVDREVFDTDPATHAMAAQGTSTEDPAPESSQTPEGASSAPGTVEMANGSAGNSAGPEGPNAKKAKRQGEALTCASRALGMSANTGRLCVQLHRLACEQCPGNPGASEVAAKLREPRATLEGVAREYGLTTVRAASLGSHLPASDPLSDIGLVAQAMRRLVIELMPLTGQPSTAIPPTLTRAIRDAVDASVALLAATTEPALRLVHLCPREGVDLPPLHDAQMMVSEARLRDAIKNALMADWPVEMIAVEAKLSGTDKHEEVAAWCEGQSVGLLHEDLCRLASWVERNHGRPYRSKAAKS